MIAIQTPIGEDVIRTLCVGDTLEISGVIYAGRDAVLPKLVRLGREASGRIEVPLAGGVVFHTAVSPAGIGPTSSNKTEIEDSIGPLSALGIKLHIGKGSLKQETVQALKEHHSVFAITPPVSALLTATIRSQEAVLFPEEGMEAFRRLEVEKFPAIVAIAQGQSLFDR